MTHAKVIQSLSDRIGGGSALLTAWVGIPAPLVAGMLAREDFDVITLDMQHGAQDISSVTQSIALVALAGKPSLVRIPVGQFAIASRVLDVGASGVIAPMINSKTDAKAFASFMKFPPLGDRSWGPTIPLAMTGLEGNPYLKAGNHMSVAIAMVETREALDALKRYKCRSDAARRRGRTRPCRPALPGVWQIRMLLCAKFGSGP